MKHKLVILNHKGDEVVEFNPKKATQVTKAKEVFDDYMRRNHVAFRKGADGKSEIIKTFDPNSSETTLTPPLVGG